jgi:alpha-methylacyl-CoA racemase
LLAPPAMPRTLVADMAAAERAVTLALAALQARARDGCGRFTEVGIVDAAFEFALPLRYGLTGPAGVLGGALPAYRLYAAQEGWVALAALEGHFMERVRSLLGIDTLEESAIAAALAGKSAGEWERLASRADVPLAAVPTQAATGLRGIDATAATTGEDSN